MRRKFIFFLTIISAALAYSCNPTEEEDTVVAEQAFSAAYGTYYGSATSMQADSLVLVFEAGSFNNQGAPSGEAKRLTVTCLVPKMPEDEIYLGDGEYTVASPDGDLPVFVPGTTDEKQQPIGTYIIKWLDANDRGAGALFTGGSINVTYSDQTEEYTISANLTDSNGNLFSNTYQGKLELTIPKMEIDENHDNLIAMYHGGGQPQRWVLDTFSDDEATGGYRGAILDIRANRVFADDYNTLQEGEYRISSDGATGTYLPGSNQGGVYTGSYYYTMNENEEVTDGILITGGTFTISRSTTSGTYIILANLSGRNIVNDQDESRTMQYIGTPIYLDMSK